MTEEERPGLDNSFVLCSFLVSIVNRVNSLSEGLRFAGIRVHHLAPSADERGVSCDENGPKIGPVRLLNKTVSGFAPRPIEELNKVFGFVTECPVDCSALVERLKGVAKAMNEGELARAVFATLFMQLPPLTEEQAWRAAQAEKLFKASADDPKHPGWPKGTEGGRGGKFRPKDGVAAETANRIAYRAIRQRIRRGLLHILLRHGARLAVDAAGDAIPGLGLVAGAATIADLAAMAQEYAELKRETDAAIKFVQNGPYSLEQLRVSPDDETFSSYDQFKKIDLAKRFGPAGDGYDYHHIVEQSASGDIPESELQSTKNIIRIPRLLHEEINAQYAQPRFELSGSLRASLNGASFDDRWKKGLEVMHDIGLLKME
ncbi:hypothetical protein [Rhodoblastus sp.]|uniref:hypothetical protein n=1 Tax=Rhodoblastus sp. TaxID=1962975 RepID=UPI003FD819C7